MSRRRAQFQSERFSHSVTQQYNELQDQLEDINLALSELPKTSQGQRGFTRKYALEQINSKFNQLKDDMRRRGYRFRFNDNKRQFFEYSDQGYSHKIKRVLKLRFRCKNNRCPEFISQEETTRNWTSYYGLTYLELYFDRNEVLRYNFKVYGQKCFSCQEYGSGQIIENQLDNLCELYCVIIRLIFLCSHNLRDGIELKRAEMYGKAPQKLKHQNRGRVIKHKQELCQACKDNECLYFYRYNLFVRSQ